MFLVAYKLLMGLDMALFSEVIGCLSISKIEEFEGSGPRVL